MSGPTKPTQSGSGFLSFNSLPPRVWVTAEPESEDEFDQTVMQHWREEGYDVTYLPVGQGGKEYLFRLKSLGNDLELGEAFALIAYGDAATLCLEAVTKPLPHLCALICFYPTSLPNPNAKYPTQLKLTVHLTVSQGLAPKFQYFSYTGVDAGFAEHDCDEFDQVASDLAWTRTLTAVRKGFKKDEGEKVEATWDQQQLLRSRHKNAAAAVANMTPDAETVFVPSLTGASGQRNLYRFYKEFFIGDQPPSLKVRLLSRTVGVDRVVDETIVSFKHDREVPWMLPGTPPTNKNVEIPMVSIVAVRGGKLVHEHVYWDQASVLLQIGLLDPNVVPGYMRKHGMETLPVAGAEQSQKLQRPSSVKLNESLPGWDKTQPPKSRAVSVRGNRRAQSEDNPYDSAPPTPTPVRRGGRPPKGQANGSSQDTPRKPQARGRAVG